MQVYSVSEFVHGVNQLLTNIPAVVQGEVSNFRVAQNRFVWFDLKDDASVVSCFMLAFQLKVQLEDGMEVQVSGNPGLFKKSGKFHLRAQKILLVGEGDLKRQYELLKEKLQAEGLFDTDRKRALPRFPQRIGLVTSQDAAAFTDVQRILQNRWNGLEITVFHVQVQGDAAPASIIKAIDYINAKYNDTLDVVIVTRGGGSMEDLQAFNDESVVRSIFSCKVPTIVAIGHERDETLSEYVADVRASTPSNAAELAVPHKQDVLFQIHTHCRTQLTELKQQLQLANQGVNDAVSVLDNQVRTFSTTVRAAHHAFILSTTQWQHGIQQQIQRTNHLTTLLRSFNPQHILKRGYTITTMANGKVLTSVSNAKSGETITTIAQDGSVDSKVV